MVGSFIIFAIAVILRLIVESLLPQYSWLENYTAYINYALYALAGVVALFIIIAIVRAILTVGRVRK